MPDNVVNVDYWRRFRIQPGDRVLDLGAGNGRHTLEAARWPCTVVAVDIDNEELRRGRYMFHADNNRGRMAGWADFLRGDAEHLPFANGAFDRIIATEVLEHVFDDQRAIGELARVLKPGGAFVISCPHHRAERLFWALSWDYWHSPGGHIRIYGGRELQRRLAESGLPVSQSVGRHAYQSVYWTIRCLFGKDRPGFTVTRLWWQFIEWHLQARNPIFEAIESALDRILPKDYVHYGRRER